MKVSVLILFLSLLFSSLVFPANLKIALLAPEGSTWMNYMNSFKKELNIATGGKINIKFYPGGIMGDEVDVLKKINIGQLQGAAFTGNGISAIVPSQRILELPMVFGNYEELDFVYQKMFPRLKGRFREKGFLLLGLIESGHIHLYSKNEITSLDQLRHHRVWNWSGDPLTTAFYEVLNVKPVSLSLPDVLSALQNNMIDTIYTIDLGLIALQWHSKVKFRLKPIISYLSGALIVKETALKDYSVEELSKLNSLSESYCRKLMEKSREENNAAIATLEKSFLKTIDFDKKSSEELKRLSLSTHELLAERLKIKEDLEFLYQAKREFAKIKK